MSRSKRNQHREQGKRDLSERGPCNGTATSLAGFESLYAPTTSGVYVNADSALTVSAWWNGVSLIATDIASLPCTVYQDTDKGKTPLRSHPLTRLVDYESNPYVDAYHFEAAILIDAICHGNGYAEIVRDPETLEPVALFNIPFGSLTPEIVTDPDDPIAGSRLVYRIDNTQGKSYLLAEDVLHLKGMATASNGLTGLSLIDKAATSLGLAIATQVNASTFFSNGSRADGFLKYKGTMSPKQKADFRKDFYADHGGAYGSNRLGFLTGEWDWIPTTVDPEKSQMLAQREFSVIEVCRWLNLPPVMLQVYDKASLSYEQSTLDYITRTLRPWLERWELELTRKLFTVAEIAQGYEIKHDLRARMRGDSAAIAHFAESMFSIGALSRNEIRDMSDYPKVEGGDVYYYGANNLAPIDPKNPFASQNTSFVAKPEAPTPSKPAPEPSRALPVPSSGSPEAIQAVRGLLEAEIGRFVRTEATTLRKALGKPDQDDRIRDFYAKKAVVVRESVLPALIAYKAVSGARIEPEDLVKRLVERSSEEIRSAADPGAVLDDWLEGKARQICEEMEASNVGNT